MNAHLRISLWVLATFFSLPAAARAGMPRVVLTITDAARPRLETISFFLVVFLVSAAAIMLLWNYLRKDWTFLPRLNFGRALVVVTLWGLLFVLVLTMISGARELMTPGAWKQQGSTYQLVEKPGEAEPNRANLEEQRRRQIERLWSGLHEYAIIHGDFPSTTAVLAGYLWTLPDTQDMSYRYVGGKRMAVPATILVHEPEVYGAERYVLFTNGDIRKMSSQEIAKALEERQE